MPTKDKDQAREQARARMRRMREGRNKTSGPVTPDVTPAAQSPTVEWTGKQAMVGGELVPVRCWHCGAYHATVQLARDCKLETEEGRVCATYGMSATARRPDRKTLVDVAAIAESLSAGKLGHLVRFGCFGPTFKEIAGVRLSCARGNA